MLNWVFTGQDNGRLGIRPIPGVSGCCRVLYWGLLPMALAITVDSGMYRLAMDEFYGLWHREYNPNATRRVKPGGNKPCHGSGHYGQNAAIVRLGTFHSRPCNCTQPPIPHSPTQIASTNKQVTQKTWHWTPVVRHGDQLTVSNYGPTHLLIFMVTRFWTLMNVLRCQCALITLQRSLLIMSQKSFVYWVILSITAAFFASAK